MLKEVEHPQLSETQLELWLRDPVTCIFLQCLEWKRLNTRDAAGDGQIVDSSNSDLTHALIHRALGQQDVYGELQNTEEFLDEFGMIDYPPPPEENKDD